MQQLEKIAVSPTNIAAGSTVSINVISEKGPFRLHELSIPKSNFRIHDLQVGKNSQFLSKHSIPSQFFENPALQEHVFYDSLPRGMTMTLVVENPDEERAQIFNASLVGELTKDSPPQHAERHPRGILGTPIVQIPSQKTATLQLQTYIVGPPLFLIAQPDLLTLVHDVRVAGQSVLAPSIDGRIPLQPRTTQIGDWICIDLKNDTPNTQTFHGTIVTSFAR